MKNTNKIESLKWFNTYKLRDDWNDVKIKVKEVWDKYDDWNESEYQFQKVLKHYVIKIVDENLDSKIIKELDKHRIELNNKWNSYLKKPLRRIPKDNKELRMRYMFSFELNLFNKLYSSLYWGYLIKIDRNKYGM